MHFKMNNTKNVFTELEVKAKPNDSMYMMYNFVKTVSQLQIKKNVTCLKLNFW